MTLDDCRPSSDHSYGNAFWTSGICDPSIPHDPNVKGSQFVWHLSPTNSSRMYYRNWDNQQPSGGCADPERCMVLASRHSYKWDDLNCTYELCSVCQIKDYYK